MPFFSLWTKTAQVTDDHAADSRGSMLGQISLTNPFAGLIGQPEVHRDADLINGLHRKPARGRRKTGNPRWTETHPESIFDSKLQQALHLLRELATSLERDKERLRVVEKVMVLLHDRDLHTGDSGLAEAGVIKEDMLLQEWLRPAVPAGLAGALRRPAECELVSPREGRESQVQPADRVLCGTVQSALLSEAESKVTIMLESGVGKWSTPDFDALELHRLTGGNGLVALGWALYMKHDWHGKLGIEPTAYESFLRGVQGDYRDVPYHNAAHAVDVAHGTHWLLSCTSGVRGAAESPLMLFASCVAAMIHDCAHDGRNNGFHIATSSELAMAYSDQAPLEMHHCAMGFRHVQATNLLSPLSVVERRRVRARVVGMVLATDFGQHTKLLNDFKLMLEAVAPTNLGAKGGGAKGGGAKGGAKGLGKGGSKAELAVLPPPRTLAEASKRGEEAVVFCDREATMSESEQLLVAAMVVKVSDLSYPSKGQHSALAWIDRCLEEFLEQGDREKELGLPVGYSRETLDKPKSQIGFFGFFVAPMYEALAKITPLQPQLNAVADLIKYWKEQQHA